MRRIEVLSDEGNLVCERCDLADGMFTRMRGLLGRSQLGAGEGLLLKPGASVHTFFMRFPIDVVFLSRDDTVLRVVEALPPWRVAGRRKARAVLELPAGACRRSGIRDGSHLIFRS